MRIAADGYIDLRTSRKIRTPGCPGVELDPYPEAEAVDGVLLDKHFLRKHGEGAYYGQTE